MANSIKEKEKQKQKLEKEILLYPLMHELKTLESVINVMNKMKMDRIDKSMINDLSKIVDRVNNSLKDVKGKI
jgi:cob(I)alamin adenosyltransferase